MGVLSLCLMTDNSPRAVARSIECLLRVQADPRSILSSGTCIRGECFKFFHSRRAEFQLLMKDLALNTVKLPPGGLLRNSVDK